MSILDMSTEEKKLKHFLVRKFSFMYPTKEELLDTIKEILEQKDSFSSSLEKKTFIVESLKDKIIEEIFINNKTDMLDRCVEMYYLKARNRREFGYKEALNRFVNFLTSLEYSIPYEMIDSFVRRNQNLQFLIYNYLNEENDYILEETVLDRQNYYLRNMLFCYCDYMQLPILSEERRIKQSRNSNLGFDSYEYFNNELESNRKNLTNQEVEELLHKAKNNDLEARNELIVAYLPYVQHLADNYIAQKEHNQVDYMDLIQEGALAIDKAIYKYESTKSSFTHYVTTWILSYMSKYIRKIKQDQYMTYGLFEELDNDSFHLFFNLEEDTIGDYIEQQNLKETLERVLQNIYLNQREQFLLTRKYGLKNTPVLTPGEIVKALKVTRQAISLSEIKLLKKIRSEENSKDLVDFCIKPDEAQKLLNKVKKDDSARRNTYTVKR